MKKIVLIVLAVAVITAIIFSIYQKAGEVKISSLESITPEDVIYYVYSYDLTGKINDFKESAFFKQLSGNILYLTMIEPTFKQIKKKVPFLPEITEKDTVLSIYSLGTPAGYGMAQEPSLGDFLFLSRIDQSKNIKIKKTLSDFYLSLSAKGKTSSDNYKGVKITNYRLPEKNMSIHSALVSDVILCSNSIGVIHKSIDLIKKQSQKSILNNPDFQKIVSRVKKDSLLWGYFSNKNYHEQSMLKLLSAPSALKGPSAVKAAASLGSLKPVLDSMNVLENSVFYLDYDLARSGFILKSYQAFSKPIKEDAGLFKVLYGSQVLDKSSYAVIPRNIIAYSGGTYDLAQVWQMLKKLYFSLNEVMKVAIMNSPRRTQIPPPAMNNEDALKQINDFLGIDFEADFIPLLDKSFGFVFADFQDANVSGGGNYYSPQKPVPMAFPRFYTFLEVKDSVKVQEIMEKIMKNIVSTSNQKLGEEEEKYKKETQQAKADGQNESSSQAEILPEKKEYLKFESESYRGVNISSISMLNFPIPAFRFNYCMLNKYLIFSFSVDLTKMIVDTFQDKTGSFSTNTELTSVQSRITNDYSSMFFFDFRRLLDNFRTTKFFIQMQSQLPSNNVTGFSKGSVDLVLNALSNIGSFTMIYRQVDDSTGESSGYIKIKGL